MLELVNTRCFFFVFLKKGGNMSAVWLARLCNWIRKCNLDTAHEEDCLDEDDKLQYGQ